MANTCTYAGGFMLINGQVVYFPYAYFETVETTLPPFGVYQDNSMGKAPVVSVNRSGRYAIIKKNPDSSPLWIIRDGAIVDPWLSIMTANDGAYHRILTLSSGNYCEALYVSANRKFRLKFYDKNSTLLLEEDLNLVGQFPIQDSTYKDYYWTLLTDGETYFGGEFWLRDTGSQAEFRCNGILKATSGSLRLNESFFGGIVIDSQDPYYFSDESGPDGGFGDFDYSGDSILPPDLPTISVADSGFVTLFAPTITQLQSLANYMWSGLFDVATFKKIFADPMDCIISLNILPVTLPEGSAQSLKVGNISTGIEINILLQQFIKVKFAARNIGVRTKSFMDYSPYVKAQLFLPFIGARSISIDEIANADVGIEYHIDLFSGACTAYVTINKQNSDGSTIHSSLYQFNGNVCANIPFTATNYNGFLGSLLQTAAAVTTAVATQGSSSAVAGALSSGIDTATAIKPDVERSGNMSATNGFLGIQKPYLIITYPHVCKPGGRDKTVGTPSFIGLSSNKPLSGYHGFTKLHKINVKGIPCTDDERQMIESALLGEGVILP